MCPQLLARRRRPAAAPPKANPKKRLKEKQFLKTVELAKELNSRGWGVIVASEALRGRLFHRGFKDVVVNPLIANKNEIILNRSRSKNESNFFVFLKFNAVRTSVFFTDPSAGEAGRELKKKQLMRRYNSWRSKKEWAKEIAKEIIEVSEKKGENRFFVVMHGHWGENVDEGRARDDGVSKRKEIIRQFMLWHYDIDASGYHNWIHKDAVLDIARRENDVGILKIPSLEYTLPFNQGAENGPHLKFYFANMEIALDFWERFLRERKQNVMPGLAANVEKRVILSYLTRMRKENLMAMGVAHPSCILNVIVKRIPVGLLNLLTEKDENGKYKYNWRAITSFVKKYADSVGEYNPTLIDYILRFDDEKTQEYFQRKVDVLVSERMNGNGHRWKTLEENKRVKIEVEEQIKPDADMRENCVGYAFAQRMKEKYWIPTHFDHDLHVYGSTKRYGRAISPLAFGRTVFVLEEGAMGKLIEEKAMESGDFVKMMRKRKFREEKIGIETETFLEVDKGRLKPVAERRDFAYKLKILKNEIKHAILNVKLAIRDLKTRGLRIISTQA